MFIARKLLARGIQFLGAESGKYWSILHNVWSFKKPPTFQSALEKGIAFKAVGETGTQSSYEKSKPAEIRGNFFVSMIDVKFKRREGKQQKRKEKREQEPSLK